jgi:hypothetical protein
LQKGSMLSDEGRRKPHDVDDNGFIHWL